MAITSKIIYLIRGYNRALEKVKRSMLKNPFVLYILAFGSVLGIYQLGWSEIYPDLSNDLLIFFAITFFTAIPLALFVSRTVHFTRNYTPGNLQKFIFPLLLVALAADILYAGGVPLWLVFTGQEYNYAEFGIPTLHVAIFTFAQTFAIIRFSDYLYSKNPAFLIQAIVPILFDLLIVNRGAILLLLVSMAFVLVIKRGGLEWKRIIAGLGAAAVVLYLFGIIGDVRSGSIDDLGKPTQDFSNSGVPKPYFWGYIYVTSPLANFQKTVDDQGDDKGEIGELMVSEMLPDFISKRILPLMETDRTEFEQVSPNFNVSGLFTRSYVYFGWTGAALIFLALSSMIIFYLNAIKTSPYRVPALALLNTMVVFCIFDNMIAFTGMSLQLIWILLLKYRSKFRNSL